MTRYKKLQRDLQEHPKKWLITGCAGFIGSNLLETLLKLDQTVVGLDNFSTGHSHNLAEVEEGVSVEQWKRFRFIEGDIRDIDVCRTAVNGIELVLHQAALGSVPRSINDPLSTNSVNVDGFLNMLVASKDESIKSFVYAASSSTYGDHPDLPKIENRIGQPLSPYAVTKLVNEIYANVFSRSYGFGSVGLRYFNVFGRRQDPNGAYAAVIPKWISEMIAGRQITINGDGETTRDFCYIENVVQANLLAATSHSPGSSHIYNIACNERTALNNLFSYLKSGLNKKSIDYSHMPRYEKFRSGDVRHSLADISKARLELGYIPTHLVEQGLEAAIDWYVQKLR